MEGKFLGIRAIEVILKVILKYFCSFTIKDGLNTKLFMASFFKLQSRHQIKYKSLD